MAEIINLNKKRKAKNRLAKEKKAADNGCSRHKENRGCAPF